MSPLRFNLHQLTHLHLGLFWRRAHRKSCMTPLLRLTDVSKSFGGVRALRGVSFELLPGEVHALVGENGAGKSTLIKVVTGAHQPDSGTVEIGGRVVTELDPLKARALGVAVIY